MLTEPMTLYKLMNLYLLKQVNFPLTNAQLTSFFTEHDYTTYFTLQQALNELEDAGLIHKEASHSSTRYDITKEGEALKEQAVEIPYKMAGCVKLDREDAKVIPIIAMTANAFTEDRLRAKEAGLNEHIAKPFDVKLLVKIIHKLVH